MTLATLSNHVWVYPDYEHTPFSGGFWNHQIPDVHKAGFPLSFLSDIPGSRWLLDHYIRLWADPGPGHG